MPVIFKPAAGTIPGSWGSISFTDTSISSDLDIDGTYLGGSILQHCHFFLGGAGANGQINLSDMDLLVDQCQIMDSATSGIYSGSTSAKLTILQSLINQNGNLGISGSIRDLTLSQTQVNNNQNGGVYFTSLNGTFTASENCQFNNNEGNGIQAKENELVLALLLGMRTLH